MLEDLGVVGEFSMNHEAEIGQVYAAGGDVGGDADPRAAITQRLQRLVAFVLAQLARQIDGRKAALKQRSLQMPHGITRVAEDQRGRRIHKPENVDHDSLGFLWRDPDGAVIDVGMAEILGRGLDAQSVGLVVLGERSDAARQRGREQQGALLGRGGLQDEFEIIAKAEVKHFVRLIQHHGLDPGQIKPIALDMVAKAPRSANHDMAAIAKLLALLGRVHAAHARDDACAGLGIEPGQFALDLKREFACRRHDQRQRRAGGPEALGLSQQGGADAKAIGHGLAGARLRRNEQVAAHGFGRNHGALHGRELSIAALVEGALKRGRDQCFGQG